MSCRLGFSVQSTFVGESCFRGVFRCVEGTIAPASTSEEVGADVTPTALVVHGTAPVAAEAVAGAAEGIAAAAAATAPAAAATTPAADAAAEATNRFLHRILFHDLPERSPGNS